MKVFHVSTFTMATLIFFILNINSALAGLDSQAIDRVNSLKLTVKNGTTQIQGNNTKSASNYKHNLSVKYQELAYKAQLAGDEETAFIYYTKSIQLDEQNGHSWYLIGTLLGNTEIGIKSLTVAALLFEQQGDDDCYQLAISLLKKFGAID